MALFRRKGNDGDGPDKGNGAGKDSSGGGFQPQPEKARKWFEHAKTASDSYNYEYAISCYANGIRLDPELMSAHEAMYQAAAQHAAKSGKAASGREIKSVDDGTPIGRFAAAEFAWMRDVNNSTLALKALEAAVKAEQREFGAWIARRVLVMLQRSKKPTKSQFLNAKNLFAEVSAWNEAIAAGEIALQLDPNDSDLAGELKDLSAQRAMDQGGYEQSAGKEGAFREFIKDADKQRVLEEEGSLSGASSVEERNLLRAKQAYEEAPTSPEAINKYGQLLKRGGTPEALEQAYEVYVNGFDATKEYRFRMAAGDIRIDRARKKVRALEDRIRENGESSELKSQRDAARQEQLELEAAEYGERVGKYPTDRPLKHYLGQVEFERGNYDVAMECFQKAKDEPKLRVSAGHMLGRCFARQGWHSDAIPEYREVLEAAGSIDQERELAIRYDLMVSIMEHAREEQDIDLAKEARDICSTIARKDISYRDIRNKRREVDGLVKELGGRAA